MESVRLLVIDTEVLSILLVLLFQLLCPEILRVWEDSMNRSEIFSAWKTKFLFHTSELF